LRMNLLVEVEKKERHDRKHLGRELRFQRHHRYLAQHLMRHDVLNYAALLTLGQRFRVLQLYLVWQPWQRRKHRAHLQGRRDRYVLGN